MPNSSTNTSLSKNWEDEASEFFQGPVLRLGGDSCLPERAVGADWSQTPAVHTWGGGKHQKRRAIGLPPLPGGGAGVWLALVMGVQVPLRWLLFQQGVPHRGLGDRGWSVYEQQGTWNSRVIFLSLLILTWTSDYREALELINVISHPVPMRVQVRVCEHRSCCQAEPASEAAPAWESAGGRNWEHECLYNNISQTGEGV